MTLRGAVRLDQRPSDRTHALLQHWAERAGMSERRFSRRYTEATGLTAGKSVERLKVEATRQLMCDSRVPIQPVSQRCGFASEQTLRRALLSLLAVISHDYRERFSSL